MPSIKEPEKAEFSLQDHKLLVLWAADCAEHVLSYFEKEYPEDDRPRKAIEAGRVWINDKITVGEARIAAFAAHAAARSSSNHPAARAAARAAGHAAATVHVVGHASHAADYAAAAAEAANIIGEREWQYQHLPEHLRFILPFPNQRK